MKKWSSYILGALTIIAVFATFSFPHGFVFAYTTTTTFSTAGPSTWTAPPGVTTISVEVRAGGGGGGAVAATGSAGGGGAGGQYVASTSFAVTPGTTYNLYVGAGGAAGASGSGGNAASGTDSMFSASSTLLAKGGGFGYGDLNAACSGIQCKGGVGSTVGAVAVNGIIYAGGNGGNGGAFASGGSGGGGEGGNSTSTGATGGNGSNGVAGTAGGKVAGLGGDGGDGAVGKTNAAGSAGTQPGGGGSGGSTTGTTNRAGAAGGTGQVTVSYTTPLVSALTDNFDDNSLDGAKWWAYEGGGTVQETGQQIVITPTANTIANNDLVSQTNYSLIGTNAYVNVKQTAAASANITTNFELRSRDPTDNDKTLGFRVYGVTPTLYAYDGSFGGGEVDLANITYNSSTMAWLRIREASGVIYWEYSSDASSWTELHHLATPTAGPYEVHLIVYETATVASPGSAQFDSFNVTPAGGGGSTVTTNPYNTILFE